MSGGPGSSASPAPYMRTLAIGRDDSPVVSHRDRKSVSAETTLARDTSDPDDLYQLTEELSLRVWRQLESAKLRGRTVKVKLRLADFTTFTRQATLSGLRRFAGGCGTDGCRPAAAGASAGT